MNSDKESKDSIAKLYMPIGIGLQFSKHSPIFLHSNFKILKTM